MSTEPPGYGIKGKNWSAVGPASPTNCMAWPFARRSRESKRTPKEKGPLAN